MSGRDRAKSDNFWATSLSKMSVTGAAFAKAVNTFIRHNSGRFNLLWVGSGWRTGSKEHSSGYALDIITSADTGIHTEKREPVAFKQANEFVNKVLIKYANQLSIRHIIWNGKIWRRRNNAWGAYLRVGSVSIRHQDHIHVLLEGASESAINNAFNSAAIELFKSPIVKTVGPSQPSKSTQPSKSVQVHTLRKGSKGDAVKRLQAGLKSKFPAYAKSLSVDGIFGSHTHAVVVEFQRRALKAGSYRGPIDGIVGPGTLAALRSYGVNI